MLRYHTMMAVAGAVVLACSQLQAADVFPVKAYVKPDEAIVVKFVNEKGPEGKQAVEQLGAEAGKLESLFAPAAAAEIAGADGAAAFKIYTPEGKEVKVGNVKPGADGVVDLSAACPQLKEGGTFYVVWKDAPPLVIETLFNPGRGKAEFEGIKARVEQLPADQKQQALARFGPAVTHMEMAQYVVITTDKGVIKAKFSYEYAPHTIDNFAGLARQGFYDGSAFHRIIPGFMIQGGDVYTGAETAGTGGPGYEIMHEFSEKKHERGTLSMARSSAPDSAGSQFFIMHQKTTSLDGGYSAFGDVFEGMDVVDAIAKTPTSDNNGTVSGVKPKIVSMRVLPATAEMYGLKK